MSVVRVIIHNVREATEEEVGEILARFGVVKEVKWNYLAPDPDLPGLEKKKDGTLTARVQLEEGKPSLPSYIREGGGWEEGGMCPEVSGPGDGRLLEVWGPQAPGEAVCEVHTNTNASLWEAAASASSLWEAAAAAAGSVSSRREQR